MFEEGYDALLYIILVLGFIVITIIIYDLMSPDWTFLQIGEDISNLIKTLTL